MLHNCILLLTPIVKIAIAGILLLAAVRDIMTRTVPNWMPLVLAMLCAGLAVMESRLIWGLGFGLVIFLFCLLCWMRGWMGGADVKLLGAAAIAIAPGDAEGFLLGVTLFGGVMAIAYLAGRFLLPRPPSARPPSARPPSARPDRLLSRVLRIEAWRIRHSGPLPYACAIAAGTLFVLS